MEKVKVLFIKSLYPYRAGETGELKASAVEKFEAKGYVERIVEGEEKPEAKKPEAKKIDNKANKSMKGKKKSNK